MIPPPSKTCYTVLAAVLLLPLWTVLPARAAEEDEMLRARLAALVAAEDFQAVLRLTDAHLGEDSESVLAWQYRAHALHRTRRHEEAIEAYEKTLDLDPKNSWAAMSLGEVLATLERWPEAIEAAEWAITLDRTSTKTWSRLCRIHRDRGAWQTAVEAVDQAIREGVDPAWTYAELGYLLWVQEKRKESREAWIEAKRAGADPEFCAHGLKILSWDRPARTEQEREQESRRRAGHGPEWIFPAGGVTVHTRVGPKLPRDVENLLIDLQLFLRKVLGVEEGETGNIRLHLSRTLEEHEVHRRKLFPEGYSGRAFFTQTGGGGSRRGPGRGRGRGGFTGTFDVYVAWPTPGLERSLSHEIAHAMLRLRVPGSPRIPVWLDEGIATYLELVPGRGGKLSSGTVRADLLASFDVLDAVDNTFSFPRMLTAPRRDFTGTHARGRYAQSWTMVHYLLEGRGRPGPKQFERFLDEVDFPGVRQPEEVFEAIYGDVEEVERDWRRHLKTLKR